MLSTLDFEEYEEGSNSNWWEDAFNEDHKKPPRWDVEKKNKKKPIRKHCHISCEFTPIGLGSSFQKQVVKKSKDEIFVKSNYKHILEW